MKFLVSIALLLIIAILLLVRKLDIKVNIILEELANILLNIARLLIIVLFFLLKMKER